VKVGISTIALAVSAIIMVSKCVMRLSVLYRNARILFICKEDAVLFVLKSFIQVVEDLHACTYLLSDSYIQLSLFGLFGRLSRFSNEYAKMAGITIGHGEKG
jgi:hypothetical protein